MSMEGEMAPQQQRHMPRASDRVRGLGILVGLIISVCACGAVHVASARAAGGAPAVSVGSVSVVEGQTFSGKVGTFTDSALKGPTCAPTSDYSVTVAWGDGAQSAPAATLVSGPDQSDLCTYEISTAHTYTLAGKDQIDVTVTGPGSQTPGTGSATATVTDAPLSATCSAYSATAGAGFTGTIASFTDANTSAVAGDYGVRIDWGDGSTSAGGVSAGQSAGSFIASGSHEWSSAGTYLVTTTITDVGGSTTTTSCSATVTAAPPSGGPPPPPPPPGPTPTPPPPLGGTTPPPADTMSARISVTTPGVLRAGERIGLATSVTTPPGFRVFEYRWDFNGDGHYDADTGSYPVASHRFARAGDHVVGVEVEATDGTGQVQTTLTHGALTTALANPGCSGDVALGFLEFVSSCIKDDHGKYSISLDGGAGFAGLELTSSHAGAKLTLDTTGADTDHHNPDHKWVLSADGPVTVSIINSAIGTIQLDTIDLQHNPVLLPVGADAPDQNAPGLRVFTLEAERSCPAHSGVPPVVCATLPGNFPIEGSISVYVTGPVAGEGLGAAVQANVALHQPLSISGNLTLTGDVTGLQLDSFGFQTPSFNIGSIVTVDPLTLSYNRRDDDTGDMDVWAASGGARLNVGSHLGVTISVRFANDRFQFASFDLHGTVPLGPVVLTELGGSLGFDPFLIGGNLAGSIGPLGLSAGVLYTDAYNGHPWHFQLGDADPAHDPHHVAPLFVQYPSVNPLLKIGGTLDVYGDGFISGGVNVNFALPNVDAPHPNVSVGGFVRGWFMPATPTQPHSSYQISGGVHAEVNVLLHLSGEAQGFVNNYWQGPVNTSWAGGCGSLTLDLGFFGHPSVGGWVRVDLAHGDHVDDGFGGCSDISAYCAPASITAGHTTPACLGFDASAAARRRTGPQRFWIPAGESAENLKLTSATGIPQVRISGPSGTYTTPSTASSTGRLPYVSGGDAAEHELAIAILHPKPGAYTVTVLPGTPAIAPLLEAHPLPDPHIRVRITGRGRTRTLRYSLRQQPAQRVMFFERAADVSTLIGRTTKSSGAIRFVPQPGLTRTRQIEADLSENAMPEKPRIVARYTAPSPRKPGKPGGVRVSRRANAVTITWKAVPGAESYQLNVIGSDGRRQLYVTGTRRRRVRIAPVFPEVALTVSLRANGGVEHQLGPAKAIRVKAIRARR
jgi:hypothetical protein